MSRGWRATRGASASEGVDVVYSLSDVSFVVERFVRAVAE
jgi:hypothetical protein